MDTDIAAAGRSHTVAALVHDGMAPFELGIVVEIFGLRRAELELPWYDLRVCAALRGPLRIAGGMTLEVEHGLEAIDLADTVIVPGADVLGATPEPVSEALRRAHRRGARMVSICSGAFTLADAGLLDGLTATTHWKFAPLLASRRPAVRVDPSVLYVDCGQVLTSAGSTAGIDVCLHIVRTDFGAVAANTVARHMVAPPHREGGQAQYIAAAVPAQEQHDAVGRAMGWALEHLTQTVTLDDLAGQANMSQRSFVRHFQKRAGTSPIRWLVDQRVRAGLPLLEGTDIPVEKVGAAVGFDSPATFRHHFRRVMGTSPAAYRRAFAHGGALRTAGPTRTKERRTPAVPTVPDVAGIAR
ncbi:helix-turn-helix domain-containing protein [Streptomyces sp. NPDC058657]|uniref:helix-turn-helix domain-containing protein n=1 Tax=unclassified Streptomyces TaxID=2593676 RepID=UPI003669EF71